MGGPLSTRRISTLCLRSLIPSGQEHYEIGRCSAHVAGQGSDGDGQTSLDKFLSKFTSQNDEIIPISSISEPGEVPLETIDLPSRKEITPQRIEAKSQKFHKLDQTYPHAPVPDDVGGMVLHNSHLHDISGVSTLFDWLADGDAAIVELGSMISRESEFNAAIDQLSQFVIDDIGGKILQISDSRILLLPPGCNGISGLLDEAFVTDNEFKTL